MEMQYCEVKATLSELAAKPYLEKWLAADESVKRTIAAFAKDTAGAQGKIFVIEGYLRYLESEAGFFRTLEKDAWKFYEENSRCDDREVLMAEWIFANLRGQHENAIKHWQKELTKAKRQLAMRRYWERRRDEER